MSRPPFDRSLVFAVSALLVLSVPAVFIAVAAGYLSMSPVGGALFTLYALVAIGGAVRILGKDTMSAAKSLLGK